LTATATGLPAVAPGPFTVAITGSATICGFAGSARSRFVVSDWNRAFARAGVTPRPAVETNSVSTLVGHARTGLPGITAQSWLQANPLPADLRAVSLTDPEIEHTIGIVTAAAGERAPVVAELLSMFAPLELDG
jgi:DNA-binding transcriptional LysR family regulator